jgi:hypothetical protein
MSSLKTNYKGEVLSGLEGLTNDKIQEVIDFIHFLKTKKILREIDPDQLYFWTKEWQEGEKKADEDIKAECMLGPFDSVEEFKKAIKDRE